MCIYIIKKKHAVFHSYQSQIGLIFLNSVSEIKSPKHNTGVCISSHFLFTFIWYQEHESMLEGDGGSVVGITSSGGGGGTGLQPTAAINYLLNKERW